MPSAGVSEAIEDIDAAAEAARPALLGLAYRMLGTRSEAEDAVQDVYLRWLENKSIDIRNPAAWLTTACTHRCIDLLRRAERQRVDYVGAWLPEPIHSIAPPDQDNAMSLAASLSTAFLLMLERLSPRERAAYLLHDIFEMDYPRIAEILEVKEPACRKLVSRARQSIGQSETRARPPSGPRQEALLAAFQKAITTRNVSEFAAMLTEDAEIQHDSGGRVSAVIHVLKGRENIISFVGEFLHRAWRRYGWEVSEINGARGLLLREGSVVVAAVSLGFSKSGEANRIYILRNPDKLSALTMDAIPLRESRLA